MRGQRKSKRIVNAVIAVLLMAISLQPLALAASETTTQPFGYSVLESTTIAPSTTSQQVTLPAYALEQKACNLLLLIDKSNNTFSLTNEFNRYLENPTSSSIELYDPGLSPESIQSTVSQIMSHLDSVFGSRQNVTVCIMYAGLEGRELERRKYTDDTFLNLIASAASSQTRSNDDVKYLEILNTYSPYLKSDAYNLVIYATASTQPTGSYSPNPDDTRMLSDIQRLAPFLSLQFYWLDFHERYRFVFPDSYKYAPQNNDVIAMQQIAKQLSLLGISDTQGIKGFGENNNLAESINRSIDGLYDKISTLPSPIIESTTIVPSTDDGGGGLNWRLIIPIAVVLVLFIAAIAMFFVLRKKKQKSNNQPTDPSGEPDEWTWNTPEQSVPLTEKKRTTPSRDLRKLWAEDSVCVDIRITETDDYNQSEVFVSDFPIFISNGKEVDLSEKTIVWQAMGSYLPVGKYALRAEDNFVVLTNRMSNETMAKIAPKRAFRFKEVRDGKSVVCVIYHVPNFDQFAN